MKKMVKPMKLSRKMNSKLVSFLQWIIAIQIQFLYQVHFQRFRIRQ